MIPNPIKRMLAGSGIVVPLEKLKPTRTKSGLLAAIILTPESFWTVTDNVASANRELSSISEMPKTQVCSVSFPEKVVRE